LFIFYSCNTESRTEHRASFILAKLHKDLKPWHKIWKIKLGLQVSVEPQSLGYRLAWSHKAWVTG